MPGGVGEAASRGDPLSRFLTDLESTPRGAPGVRGDPRYQILNIGSEQQLGHSEAKTLGMCLGLYGMLFAYTRGYSHVF